MASSATQPLRPVVKYDFQPGDSNVNSIDFRRFDGNSSSAPEIVVTPTHHSTSSETFAPQFHASKTSVFRFANATNPVLLVISSSERGSVAARFFTFRLFHFFRYSGESSHMCIASENYHDHHVPFYSADRQKWEQHHKASIQSAFDYFDSDTALGFAATPLAIVYGDCMSPGAMEAFTELLPKDRKLVQRHIWFTEDEVEKLVSPQWIIVSLSTYSLRLWRENTTVVCSLIAFYLNNYLHILQRIYLYEPLEGNPMDTLQCEAPIFFMRHGQSEYNLEDRLGGNPDLTDAGREDARVMGAFFEREVVSNQQLFAHRNAEWERNCGFEVWCSQLCRTQSTAEPTAHVLTNGCLRTFKSLNEIHAGICEDMTNEDIKAIYPHIQHFRHTDKVGYRYPNGESYRDLVRRLTPLAMELTTSPKCTVVVGHQAVLRSMLSFFGGHPVEKAVHEPCPQRTIWACTSNRVGEFRLAQIELPRRSSAPQEEGVQGWTGW